MIYFDNAATSRYKPEEVYNAFNFFVKEIGVSPGRGSYDLGIQASRMLYQSRKTVANFFGANVPSNVIFTKNSTEAINLFFNGFLQPGDHVLISPYEHNAVLRPLHALMDKGVIEYTVLSENAIYTPEQSLEQYIKPNTKLIAVTLASNLTGQIVFSKILAKEARKYGLTVFVDSSQGAGKCLINMERDCIDVLAFTGHKDLLALPGVGGLVSREELRIRPLIQGGTGIHGENYVNPDAFPDAYEAGTINMPAIWSLKASISFINSNKNYITDRETALIDALIFKMSALENVTVYNASADRVSTICFNVKGVPSSDVVNILNKNSICVRGGMHCAILAHKTLGTVKTGAVRVSISYHNTESEIDEFIEVIKGIK